MGLMQLDHCIAGYRAMWHGLTHFVDLKAIPYASVIFTQCLHQIAVSYLHIWLSYGGNMTPCICELLQPV